MQFLNYFKMVLRAPRPKASPIALWIAGYFVFFFGIYAGKEIIASFAFLAGMVMCYYFNSTPNMEAVFPVNHRKKLAYRFLSSLLMYLCMLVVVFVVGVVVFLITAVFVSISEGGFDWINKTPVEGDIFGGFNVYGLLFGFAYLIIMYSAGMITGFFKKRKTRNVWLACLCIAVVLAFVLMSLPYCFARQSGVLRGNVLALVEYGYMVINRVRRAWNGNIYGYQTLRPQKILTIAVIP